MFPRWRWILLQLVLLGMISPQVFSASAAVDVPHISQAPKLEDFEGMAPKGAAAQLQHVTNFIENHPSDGKPATERTEAYLGHNAIPVQFSEEDFETYRRALQALPD